MQWGFHQTVAPLYADPALQALLPGLATRARLALVEQDMADLGLPLPAAAAPHPVAGEATALGWLYVAEGSSLGAAVLRKLVARIGLSDTFGARHLALPQPARPPTGAISPRRWMPLRLTRRAKTKPLPGRKPPFPMSPPWPSRRAAKPQTGPDRQRTTPRRQGSATGSFALQHLRYEGANQQRLRGQERGR
jgi:hypothetical protein